MRIRPIFLFAKEEEEEEEDDPEDEDPVIVESCSCGSCPEDPSITPLCCKMSPCLSTRPEGNWFWFLNPGQGVKKSQDPRSET